MPRTFLVERIVDTSSSVKDIDAKFKVNDDVTLDDVSHESVDEVDRFDEMRPSNEHMMTSCQQQDVAMETSVIDYSARPSVRLQGKS